MEEDIQTKKDAGESLERGGLGRHVKQQRQGTFWWGNARDEVARHQCQIFVGQVTEAVFQATEETLQLTFRKFLSINIKRQDQLIQSWSFRHDRIQEQATDEVHVLVRNELGGQKRIPKLTSDGLRNLP